MRYSIIGHSGGLGRELAPFFKEAKLAYFRLPFVPEIETDVVINLASLTQNKELHDSYDYSKMIDVNCLGVVNILQSVLPYMREQRFGRIILFSSVFSEINIKGQGVYSASKAFVDKLVKIAAIENAEYGITVNSIQLGYTGIGMGKTDDPRAINKPAMKRFCTIEEIYQAIQFIINTEYFTGQNLRLDGGIR